MKNTNAARNTLTKKLESIRTKREALRKQFDEQLEKVWAEHRAKMAKLRDARKAAYAEYDAKIKGTAEPKAKRSRKPKAEAQSKVISIEDVEFKPAESEAEQPALTDEQAKQWVEMAKAGGFKEVAE